MAATPLLHLGDGELCDVKEPGDVDAHDRPVVGLGVRGERFGDEDAGVVDERVDAPEPCHAFGDRTRGRRKKFTIDVEAYVDPDPRFIH